VEEVDEEVTEELELETANELVLLCEKDTEGSDEMLDTLVDADVEPELLGVPVG